jgi:enoyl-CoA hydratase/carnithine racemase
VRALRAHRLAQLAPRLDAAERLYVDELLRTHDGSEGIRAFLEKRAPRWENR